MNDLLGNQYNADYNAQKDERDKHVKKMNAKESKLIKPLPTRTSTLKSIKMNAMARKMKGLPPLDPATEYQVSKGTTKLPPIPMQSRSGMRSDSEKNRLNSRGSECRSKYGIASNGSAQDLGGRAGMGIMPTAP